MKNQGMLRWVAGLVGAVTMMGAGAASAATYVDYWGDDLFGGLVYHRFGCFDDDNNTLSNQDYDGFTTQRYCFAGQAWDSQAGKGYVFLDWNFAANKAQLDACGTQTNNQYGTPNYAARSNTCSYNVFTDCNSDCWIEAFSSCQGYEIATLSPCF